MMNGNLKLSTAARTVAVWALAGVGAASADEFRFEVKADWDSWAFPQGVLAQHEDGSIGLSRVDKLIDAAADARDFLHTIKSSKEPIPGGIRVVGSGAATAVHVIDGRTDTWWQPDPDAARQDRWVEVDLGRMVHVTKIRLIFPDTLGVRPFRSFSVYVNDGERATAARDVFRFTRVGRTTEPNDRRVVEYDLTTLDPGQATGDHLNTADTLGFAGVQYIRFRAEEDDPAAALAGIEVIAIGDNLALGSVGRGGGIRAGSNVNNSSAFSDGDHNTKWIATGTGTWEDEGFWFEWDLGAVYWLDRMIIQYGHPWGRPSVGEFVVSTSAGASVGGLTIDRVRSNFDYQQLTLVDAKPSPVRFIYDLMFPPRKVRHIFYHNTDLTVEDAWVWYMMLEYALYGEGYVAEVEMMSDFIDLGGTKSIRRLTWDADLPAGTLVEIRSQTGDTFRIESKYYHKSGIEISEAQWNKLPKSQKQPLLEIRRRGSDWSGWSPVYVAADAVFLSPSPRRFVQLQVKLGNDNPVVTPLLRNIVLHFDDALVSGGVTSRILPRLAGFDSLQTFRFVLTPDFRSGDQGFNRVQIRMPAPVEEIAVKIGGVEVVPTAMAISGDSLQVDLPQRVRRDSVEVEFQTRIQTNATTFDAWISVVGESLRQGTRPEADDAVTVFVPSVASAGRLIRQIEVSPLVSPNGDGINDEASIAFALAKVEGTVPEVAIYDLSGRRVRAVAARADGYRWDGRDEDGRLLPPGAYICRIELAADIGDEMAHRVINLAY
ncbi:MAG: gliding motility-associated C-terminal domain-containing protein [Candidatus Latescibacterota bacterium]